MKLKQLFALIIASMLCAVANAKTHKELGSVKWLRNYDQAVEQSTASGKPILILFQEVPGCQGCVDYGQQTLRHPLIVDSIENDFVPVAIRNNAALGHDKKILKQFNEPAWNFQVMRFLDTEGNDLIPRKDRVWTPAETAERMIQALEAAKRPVPDYLRTVALSAKQSNLKTGVFSMFCFWDGEAKLGGIPGVVETEAGWLEGREVVRLRYDPEQIAWNTLVKKAQASGCAKQVYAPDSRTLAETPKSLHSRAQLYDPNAYRSARVSDQKRHLQASSLRKLSLNPVQRTKINAALSGKDHKMIARWLSPSQIEALM